MMCLNRNIKSYVKRHFMDRVERCMHIDSGLTNCIYITYPFLCYSFRQNQIQLLIKSLWVRERDLLLFVTTKIQAFKFDFEARHIDR